METEGSTKGGQGASGAAQKRREISLNPLWGRGGKCLKFTRRPPFSFCPAVFLSVPSRASERKIMDAFLALPR